MSFAQDFVSPDGLTTYGVRRQGGPVCASLIKTLPCTRANHYSESSCVFTVFYHAIRCCDKNPLADRPKLNKILSPPPLIAFLPQSWPCETCQVTKSLQLKGGGTFQRSSTSSF